MSKVNSGSKEATLETHTDEKKKDTNVDEMSNDHEDVKLVENGGDDEENKGETSDVEDNSMKKSNKVEIDRILRPGHTYFNLNPFDVLNVNYGTSQFIFCTISRLRSSFRWLAASRIVPARTRSSLSCLSSIPRFLVSLSSLSPYIVPCPTLVRFVSVRLSLTYVAPFPCTSPPIFRCNTVANQESLSQNFKIGSP